MNAKGGWYPENRGSVVLWVEEEGAEDGDMHAVRQDRQVGLWELEGGTVLLEQLPDTLQEEQEDRRHILGEEIGGERR